MLCVNNQQNANFVRMAATLAPLGIDQGVSGDGKLELLKGQLSVLVNVRVLHPHVQLRERFHLKSLKNNGNNKL